MFHSIFFPEEGCGTVAKRINLRHAEFPPRLAGGETGISASHGILKQVQDDN
jgi:hypothetical protein